MSAYVDDISENRRDDLMRVIRGAVEQPGRASVGRPIDEAVADAVIAWIDSGGVVVEEPEWEPSAQDLLDAIYNPDEDSENHSVRYGYILEQLERLRGKR